MDLSSLLLINLSELAGCSHVGSGVPTVKSNSDDWWGTVLYKWHECTAGERNGERDRASGKC